MKVEINIPSNLNEIPLKNYQIFIEETKDSKDNLHIANKILEHFCNVKLKDILQIKYTDVIEISNHFNTIFNKEKPLITRFELGGVEFGFIPNFEEITSGEYIDLENYLKDVNTLHKAMAVMFRPITKKIKCKYEIEPYISSITYAEVMEFAPLDVVLSAQVFFWNLGQELLSYMPTYLESQLKKMKKKDLESFQNSINSQNNGDGIQAYMNSLKEMLQDSMKLPDYRFINF